MPDYESCSREDLLDVLRNIDRELYPERVAEVYRVLNDPAWIANEEDNKKRSLSEKEKPKLHINKRLDLPLLILVFLLVTTKILYFLMPDASYWDSLNNNFKYFWPISIVTFFLANLFLNFLDKKSTNKNKNESASKAGPDAAKKRRPF